MLEGKNPFPGEGKDAGISFPVLPVCVLQSGGSLPGAGFGLGPREVLFLKRKLYWFLYS